MIRVCCPGERLLAEKKSTFTSGTEPVTIGAVNFTVDKLSIVYKDVGLPYIAVTPTGPYTLIVDPACIVMSLAL
jgi:hypothetical protein